MMPKKTIRTAVLTSAVAAGAVVVALTFPVSTATPAATATTTTSTLAVTALLAPDAALTGWPVLRQGPNSTWPKVTVRSLQYLLDAHGAKVTVDGLFGPKTTAAVVAFQRAHHLAADGVVGAQTWSALIITVQQGSTGYAVRAVQDQLDYRGARYGYSIAVDGIFGPTTRLAVLAFQAAGKVTPDGIVGPVTWHALINESLVA